MMILELLDSSFNRQRVIDNYQSVIWTERYHAPGEFEVFLPYNSWIDTEDDYILRSSDSNVDMLIENIYYNSDVGTGVLMKLTGRSLTSLLDRRATYPFYDYHGPIEDVVAAYMRDNLIAPGVPERAVSNFSYIPSTSPTALTQIVDSSADGKPLSEKILELCEGYGLGQRITVTDSGHMNFEIYEGKDRSYNQDINPRVVFSPEFENISKTSYDASASGYRNIALVGGEGQGTARVIRYRGENLAGFRRRETFTDASSIQKTNGQTTMSDADYETALFTKGDERLAETRMVRKFEGEADVLSGMTFRLGRDFGLGDIVHIADKFGMEGPARVTQIIHSHAPDKYTAVPTFSML